MARLATETKEYLLFIVDTVRSARPGFRRICNREERRTRRIGMQAVLHEGIF